MLVLASFLVSVAMSDSSKDKEECAQQLAGLATCLTYVGGQAKSPTPDCCSGLKQVLKNNKKCLCVIIKDRNDPDLGLQINATLALSLPSVCDAPANVSKCPELLQLDPKSPETQLFYQLEKSSSEGGPSPAPSARVGASPASARSEGTDAGSHATSTPQKSDAFCNENRSMGFQVLVRGFLVGLFMCSYTWILM
ncbi:hypothetical protein L6164_017776 [Bauhinia variegata]|uniref:Uncharacterized protein n=1 Tax=Bauhinia variegata TaxID=167791 RepID=A0ACB9N8Z8_BAUVA|nr:hypothetical protein L6164_017776 [Bauhinia variegata]